MSKGANSMSIVPLCCSCSYELAFLLSYKGKSIKVFSSIQNYTEKKVEDRGVELVLLVQMCFDAFVNSQPLIIKL